jgi:hypothetical protein
VVYERPVTAVSRLAALPQKSNRKETARSVEMTLARPFKGNDILGASMSDMLQLVVEIRNPQAMILLVSRPLEFPISTTS